MSPGATYTYGVVGLDQNGTAGAMRSLSLTTSTGDNTTGFAGIVRDRAGHPVPGVQVATQSENGHDGPSVTTGADGTYRVSGLAPGNYGACFEPWGVSASVAPTGLLLDCYRYHGAIDGQWPATITVAAGRITPSISAILSPGAAFSGTVTDAAGHPLAGVTVYADFRDTKVPVPPHTITGSDGTYSLRGIPASSATACFRGDSGVRGGVSDTGYVGQCYRNAPMSGQGTKIPADPRSDHDRHRRSAGRWR